MSERGGPRTLADRKREMARERGRRVSEQEWEAFLEVFYRALLMLARWIERRRK